MVAEVDRVGKRLERERVLGEAGHRQRTRDGAERQHEVIHATVCGPSSVSIGGGLRLEVEPVALPRISSACGHIARSGTTQWRGSSVPAAASGSSGV